MRSLAQATRERLDHWERTLRDALEQTEIQDEKRRLERELLEIGQTRLDLESMDRPELEQLHERLGRDPTDWVAHHGTSVITPDA